MPECTYIPLTIYWQKTFKGKFQLKAELICTCNSSLDISPYINQICHFY